MAKRRLRITIEVDTEVSREAFNAFALNMARDCVTVAGMGEMVYCATELVTPRDRNIHFEKE